MDFISLLSLHSSSPSPSHGPRPRPHPRLRPDRAHLTLTVILVPPTRSPSPSPPTLPLLCPGPASFSPSTCSRRAAAAAANPSSIDCRLHPRRLNPPLAALGAPTTVALPPPAPRAPGHDHGGQGISRLGQSQLPHLEVRRLHWPPSFSLLAGASLALRIMLTRERRYLLEEST